MGSSKSIASIIKYDKRNTPKNTLNLNPKKRFSSEGQIAIIGAGNFTKMTMLPALLKTSAKIKHIVSSGGVTGTALAKKYNISNSTTDYKIVLDDKNVKMVMITTRHNLHSKMIIDALEKDKHVFVEKPLSLDLNELTKINDVYEKNKGTLMVGYNRRFSPHIQKKLNPAW